MTRTTKRTKQNKTRIYQQTREGQEKEGIDTKWRQMTPDAEGIAVSFSAHYFHVQCLKDWLLSLPLSLSLLLCNRIEQHITCRIIWWSWSQWASSSSPPLLFSVTHFIWFCPEAVFLFIYKIILRRKEFDFTEREMKVLKKETGNFKKWNPSWKPCFSLLLEK